MEGIWRRKGQDQSGWESTAFCCLTVPDWGEDTAMIFPELVESNVAGGERRAAIVPTQNRDS